MGSERHTRYLLVCDLSRKRSLPLTQPSVFLVMFTIGSVLAIILQCNPVAAGYDITLRAPTGTGTCYSVDIFKKVGVFNSCKICKCVLHDCFSSADHRSYQHRYRSTIRYTAYSARVEIAAHDTNESRSGLYPQLGFLRCGHRYLQDTNAVPLFRGERLHRPRLMVLYVMFDPIPKIPDLTALEC